ncbi:MAG: hypothetical protein WBR29_07140 [Gammaproteobacteria bacterium]
MGDYAGFFVGYTYWIQVCAVQTALSLLIGLVFLAGVAASDRRHTLIAFACLFISYPVYLGVRKLRCRI